MKIRLLVNRTGERAPGSAGEVIECNKTDAKYLIDTVQGVKATAAEPLPEPEPAGDE